MPQSGPRPSLPASRCVGLGWASVVLCFLLALAALTGVVVAWPPTGLYHGPRLGILGYLLSSSLCAFFALAAFSALGGSLGGCYRLAAPPSSGFTCGGCCPIRVYRWHYRRHLPVSSLCPLCRESVNLSTLVGLSRGSFEKGGFSAADGWLLWRSSPLYYCAMQGLVGNCGTGPPRRAA